MRCDAVFQGEQCLWRSEAAHEHRAWKWIDEALYLIRWGDGGETKRMRVQRMYTVDGSLTYVDSSAVSSN